jgi:hypothetical protein
MMATEFHAVSIKIKPDACAAVKALAGKRFLSREAKLLPLPDCDNPNCSCVYEHHEDRRAGSRRDSDVGLQSSPPEGSVERRHQRGRRATD